MNEVVLHRLVGCYLSEMSQLSIDMPDDAFNNPLKARGAPGVIVFDYDNDNDLDIYVANGPGRSNSLYANTLSQSGKVGFVDMADQAGVGLMNKDNTGVCYTDIDNDGDDDLYVCNDFAPDSMLRNDTPRGAAQPVFVDVTSDVLTYKGFGFGMGASYGDFDRDGDLARSGTAQPEALARLQQWPYLHREGPKSLAAEDLDPLHDILDGIPDPRNAAATAVEWVAQTVAGSLDPAEEASRTLLVTGGGAHHHCLMERLRTLLPKGWTFEIPDPAWVDGKEAIAFAWLALRTAQGKLTSLATVTGASQDVCGGVLFGTFATP